jgi:hypothetical protein
LTIFVICLGALLAVEGQTKIVRRAIDNIVYDNRNHYLPCEKLPGEAEVNQVIQEHWAVIRSIEQVNPEYVGVEVELICPGKADIVIWYASHEDRVAIENIIGGSAFFGVPYRLQNR